MLELHNCTTAQHTASLASWGTHKLEVARAVQHEVLGLEVAVDHAARMEIVDTFEHIGDIEP